MERVRREMKRRLLVSLLTAFIILSMLAVFGTTGCTGSQSQSLPTMSTSIETAAAATTQAAQATIQATQTDQTTQPPASGTTAAITPGQEKIPANFELVYIPKLDGLPWFKVVQKGLEQCAVDYGFKATVISPPKADPAIQEQIVLDYIGKNVDAIAVCPITDKTMDEALAKANAAGIMTFSNEGYTLKNVSYDIEAATGQAFGEAMIQSAIKNTGGTGKYIVSVGFLNSILHSQWADAEIAFQQKNAPNLTNILGYTKGTDRFEDSEDIKIATTKITEYLAANKDLKLIIGNSMNTGIAAGELIGKKRLQGKLMFVGSGLPVTIGEYIIGDILQEGFFWDPYLIGYAIGYVSFKTWMGTPLKSGEPVSTASGSIQQGYESLGLGVNAAGAQMIYGNAIASITKANVEDWYKKFEGYGWAQK
jgi:ABC-type sugar transport system substrate-binding protein